MYEFNFHQPETVEAAINFYSESEDPMYLAGGHTLIPSMKQRLRGQAGFLLHEPSARLMSVCVQPITVSYLPPERSPPARSGGSEFMYGGVVSPPCPSLPPHRMRIGV